MAKDQVYKEDEATAWLWVGCWLLIIYITIPLARTVQEFIKGHGGSGLFLVATFASFTVAASLLIRSMMRRTLRCTPLGMLILGVILGLFCFLAWKLRANPEESLHFVQYGVLSLLLYRALNHRLHDASVYIVAMALGASFGIFDELIQWVVPRRYFDFRDIGINVTAVLLVQLAIALGVRPVSAQGACSSTGIRMGILAACLSVVLLMFCFANTEQLKDWYGNFLPSTRMINEVTATYGYQIDDPAIGRFYSRLKPDELLQQDRERSVEVAAILDQYKIDRHYDRFLHIYPAFKDPFLVEARVHLFRRDRHGSLAIKGEASDHDAIIEHIQIAYRENQILKKYFPETLARSSYVWAPHIEQTVLSLIGDPPPYDSPVSRYVITRFSLTQIISILSIVLIGLLFFLFRTTPRPTS